MYFYPTVIVDDFFKYPLKVREYALSLKYEKGEHYSGIRTEDLFNINEYFAKQVCKKILLSCGIPYKEFGASVYFHLTGEEFGEHGWPHMDFDDEFDTKFASIVYLNLEPTGLESGTSLLRPKEFLDIGSYRTEMRESFSSEKEDTDLKSTAFKKFEESIKIGGAFNRMVSYDSRRPHCGNGYFGKTISDKRLTLLAFFDIIKPNLANEWSPIVFADMMTVI